MSADNYYYIQRHPNGGYVVNMGFASAVAHFDIAAGTRFDSFRESMDWAMDQDAEYPVSYHEECYTGIEVYVRGAEGTDHAGECKYLSFEEGFRYFLSEHGYRLTIEVDGVTVTLRKDNYVDDQSDYLDKHLGHTSVDTLVTVGMPEDFKIEKMKPDAG